MSLKWEQVKKVINNVTDYLNTIDLIPYLEKFKGKTVKDMMDKLEEEYPYTDEYSEILFDVISEEDFADYLNNRYGLNIRETTVTYYYI